MGSREIEGQLYSIKRKLSAIDDGQGLLLILLIIILIFK